MIMRTQRPPSRQAGLSILEVMIASLILAAILAITFSILASSSAHVETTQITLRMESDARELVNQITKDLRESRFSLVKTGSPSTPFPTDGSPHLDIEFRMPGLKTNLQNYSANPDGIFTRKVSYFWELDLGEKGGLAGTDDNKDGLIDEGVVRKREAMVDVTGAELTNPAPVVTTICRSLKKDGLEFSTKILNTISVKIILEKKNPKNPKLPVLSKTVESSIELRN